MTRLVDGRWIQQRMDQKDARVNAAARTEAERLAFHLMLTHPGTAARLDAMLADNERIDAAQREADQGLADVVPCIDLEIVPAGEGERGPVVDVVIVPKIGGAK